MALKLRDFFKAHGGNDSVLYNAAQLKDKDDKPFTSIQTVDGNCYVSFSRKHFTQEQTDSPAKVLSIFMTQGDNLDVLQGSVNEGVNIGKTCYTIVPHSDLYKGFTF